MRRCPPASAASSSSVAAELARFVVFLAAGLRAAVFLAGARLTVFFAAGLRAVVFLAGARLAGAFLAGAAFLATLPVSAASLKSFNGRDAGDALRLDADRLAGGGVATHPSLAVDAGELGEAGDAHRITLGDGLGDRVDERLQRGIGGLAVGFGALGECEHEFSAVQTKPPGR